MNGITGGRYCSIRNVQVLIGGDTVSPVSPMVAITVIQAAVAATTGGGRRLAGATD